MLFVIFHYNLVRLFFARFPFSLFYDCVNQYGEEININKLSINFWYGTEQGTCSVEKMCWESKSFIVSLQNILFNWSSYVFMYQNWYL